MTSDVLASRWHARKPHFFTEHAAVLADNSNPDPIADADGKTPRAGVFIGTDLHSRADKTSALMIHEKIGRKAEALGEDGSVDDGTVV